MEIYKGVHQISSVYGGRHLFQYLFVADRTVLVDSGVAETPVNCVYPYMDKLGLDPGQLSLVITTHPDMDHQGGNAAIRKETPSALIACGEADRRMVEDPKCLYRERYNYLQKDHELGIGNDLSPDAGDYCRVDIGFRGGERVALSHDWGLDVLHVPGHSSGHLALFDHKSKTAFVSDAIHGHGCPRTDGNIAIPVTYYFVDLYLSTLEYLELLNPDALYTGHWPSMHGDQVRDFFSDSRRTVEVLDRSILRALTRSRTGLTLADLIQEARNEFPEWPADTVGLAMFPIKGHLDRLESRGRIRLIPAEPHKWEIV